MNLRFSQRIGLTPATKAIQLESMDNDLRSSLWNVVKAHCLDDYIDDSSGSYKPTLAINIWCDFYKVPIDDIPWSGEEIKNKIKNNYFQGQWYEVYDFIEFIYTWMPYKRDKQTLITEVNKILEREFSGYRFINDKLAPITNQIEIQEIEDVLEASHQYSALKGVNIHLKASLGKLSDKREPDYRNSIKESVSAVESVAKIIAESEKDTLGPALKKIKDKIGLHSALEKGFANIYGYTSNSDGIRHALIEDANCDFDDAKYMLISCSAFVNYLISKAIKAGIDLNILENT